VHLLCAGFCGETDEEHAATVDLMRSTKYDAAFMFAYSQRDKTSAARHLQVRLHSAVPMAACMCSVGPPSLQLLLRNTHSMIQLGAEPRP
jgi:hypothetical protein